MKKLLLLLLVGLVFVSCKKDADSIEKNLWNKSGTWDIKEAKITQTHNGETILDLTMQNVGTFVFRKDGTGTVTTNIGGETDTDDFTYSVLSDAKMSFTNDDDDDAEIIDIDWKKNKLTLNFTDEDDGDISTMKYSLEKQK